MGIWLRQNGFTLGLLAAVALAFVVPEAGARGGWLRSEVTGRLGVFLIFFLQGLNLPGEALRAGLKQGRLHLFIQGWIFLGAPLVALLLTMLAAPWLDPAVRAGVLFLAVLPTTISSAIVLTSNAGGDVAGAVFNTALANLLGVLLTPLWCVLLLSAGGVGELALGPVLLKLVQFLVVPMVLGQLCRPFLKATVLPRIKPWIKPVSNAIICFLVFAAFSQSNVEGTWGRAGGAVVFAALAGAAVLLTVVGALVWWSARSLFTAAGQRATAFFCGSQKTLAAGIPMAAVIFGANSAGAFDPALLVLPLMAYHPLQLVLGSWLAGRSQRVFG